MLIFRRLFNFEQEKVVRLDHRLNRRYTPGATFPLRARLIIGDRECRGVIQNLSGNGVGLLIGRENTVTADQSVRVRFELDRHHLDLPARLAHH